MRTFVNNRKQFSFSLQTSVMTVYDTLVKAQ